jgi:hydrogenase maturation protease
VKRVLIAGIGNILLGDDCVGPYVLRLLEVSYSFDEGVVLEDLGTPALDFIDHIAGLDALIVIDSVDNGKPAGTITLYRNDDLKRNAPAVRMDTHSPAITESLLAAEVFFGVSPREILLVGVSAASYDAGCILTDAVKDAVPLARQAVLAELDRLDVSYRSKTQADNAIWWSETQPQLG